MRTIQVADLLSNVEFLNEGYDIPNVFKYKNNTYYLKTYDGAFDGYYTKSGINFIDRVDVYHIYCDVIKIIEE